MARPKKDETESKSKITFFGEIDLNKEGGITSDMPAWYFERQIEDLEENITRKKGMLERGQITADQVPVIRSQIEQEQEKLKQIVSSRPRFTDDQVDRCWGVYKSLTEQIKDSMPTRKQTKDGLVNPYNELKRLKNKHIKIDPEIAAACGVKPIHGKITGDEANKCYQIIGKALGENTNVEALRRDGNTEAYQSMDDLTKAILSGIKIREA